MADVFDFYIKDNRTIQYNLTEPIMLEDSHVSDWVFHIPRVLNNIDMSGWAWWLVYINARGQKYSELLTLSEDPESPLEKCIATYSVDYGMSIKAGIVRFSLEAINADTQGTILNEWHTQTYQAKVQDTLQGNQVEFAETESDIISALIVEVQNKVSQLVGGATPEPVSLIADMTDPKKVYLYVGSEDGESTNYWYYHNGTRFVPGGLYSSGITVDAVPTQGSNNAVSSGGVWSALAEITKDTDALTDKIDAVVATESSSEVVNVDMSGLQRVTGKKINTNNNLIDASEGYSVVWVQVPFTGNIIAVSSYTSQYVARIYNNVTDSTDITRTNFAQILQKTDKPNTKVGTVTAGQYLVCQAWDDAYTISATVETENEESYTLKQDIGLTNQMESEVDAKIDASVSVGISSAINLANETLYANNGWKTLPADDFELGGWTSYTGKDSRKYRVRYTKTLSFDRDICILADAGFYAEIIKSDGTDLRANTTISVPANTEFKIFARRINEDSSETADITTFANALKISTPLTDMERYADTFTDLSMFPRIGICGDSYAAGGGIISGIRPLTWGKNLERQIGSTVDIYAKSGESIVGWNSDATNGLPALLSGEECGLYWMAHGINGTGSDASIGTSADMSTTPHPETFYGQYVEAIEQIKTAFPDAKIILQTITGTSYGLYQASQYTKVNTAIRAIAEYCGVLVIDVADDDLYKSTWYANSMLSNHPTAMLNAGIAHANRRLFAKCVMNNPDYFVNYGNRYD